jgi:hypothetical protein
MLDHLATWFERHAVPFRRAVRAGARPAFCLAMARGVPAPAFRRALAMVGNGHR